MLSLQTPMEEAYLSRAPGSNHSVVFHITYNLSSCNRISQRSFVNLVHLIHLILSVLSDLHREVNSKQPPPHRVATLRDKSRTTLKTSHWLPLWCQQDNLISSSCYLKGNCVNYISILSFIPLSPPSQSQWVRCCLVGVPAPLFFSIAAAPASALASNRKSLPVSSAEPHRHHCPLN